MRLVSVWYKITKKKIMKKFYENCVKTSSRPLSIFKEFCKKKSEEICVLILTSFDRFANTYLI